MSNRPNSFHPSREALRVAWSGMAAMAIALGIGRFAFTPIFPMMQVDLGLSLASGAWLASVNYLGYFLGALTALMVRGPAPIMIRIGLVVITVTTLGMGFGGDVGVWMVLRTIAGVGSAWVLVFSSAWSLQQLDRLKRVDFGGLVFAGVGVGIAVSGGVCLWLMQMREGAFLAWTLFGMAAALVTILTWSTFKPIPKALPSDALLTRARPMGLESIRLILCYGLYGFGYIIPATFLPVMARKIVPAPSLFGWAWPIFGSAAAASTLVAVRWANKGKNRRLWIVAHLIMAGGIALVMLWPGFGSILLVAVLVGGTFMVVPMAATQEARALAGTSASRLIAAMSAAFAAGQIVGPLTVRWLRTDDFAGALSLACALLVLSALGLVAPIRSRSFDEDGRRISSVLD